MVLCYSFTAKALDLGLRAHHPQPEGGEWFDFNDLHVNGSRVSHIDDVRDVLSQVCVEFETDLLKGNAELFRKLN